MMANLVSCFIFDEVATALLQLQTLVRRDIGQENELESAYQQL